MKPWEFLRITPHEFKVMLDGFFRRRDRELEVAALISLCVIKSSMAAPKGRPLTMRDIVGRTLKTWPFDAEPAETTVDIDTQLRTAFGV